MRAAILLVGLFAFGFMSNASAQSIYKWVDGEGVTHFGASPPAGVQAVRTSVKSKRTNYVALQQRTERASEMRTAVNTRKKLDAEENEKQETQADKDREVRTKNCDKAKERLLTYNTAPRLYRPLENGEREYLSDDELDAERANAQRLVNQWCD